MKIRVRWDDLIAQLPDPLKTSLLLMSSSAPGELYLTGDEVPDLDQRRAEYPEIYKALTVTEWSIFQTMVSVMPRYATLGELSAHVENSSALGPAKIVAVHIFHMRRKFTASNFGFEIFNVRRGRDSDGG